MIFSRSAATIDSLDNVRITRDGPHTTLSVSDGQNITELIIHDKIKAELVHALIKDEVERDLKTRRYALKVEEIGGMPVELLQNLRIRVKGVTTDA